MAFSQFFGSNSNEVHYDIIVGPGSMIVGNIMSEGSIRVDGRVEGDIKALGKVIVSEGASVTGDIIGDSAEIQGTCDGSVSTKGKVTLLGKSIVHGDIQAQSLSTLDGATFTGNCSINPLNTLEITIPLLSKPAEVLVENVEESNKDKDSKKK